MSVSGYRELILSLAFTALVSDALAIADQGVLSEYVVRDKALQDEQAGQMKPAAVAGRELRVSEAEQRAKRIHNLAPDQVAAWVEGRITEDELGNVSPESRPLPKPVTFSIPPRNLIRLALAAMGVLVFGLLHAFRRRRAADTRSRQRCS